MRRFFLLPPLILVLVGPGFAAAAHADSNTYTYSFQLGFATITNLLLTDSVALAPTDNEGHNPQNGDGLQLWKKPINLAADGAVIREMSAEHGKLAIRPIPTFNSFFHIVDPRQYPSVQQLEAYLNAVGASGAAFKVLRCVSGRTIDAELTV